MTKPKKSRANKGLKKAGMRGYTVSGPGGRFMIDRERPWRWLVRPASVPPPFYSEQFRGLREARAVAETWAGIDGPE